MKQIKISVVTVSYNQGKYIRENIESVLNQGYDNFEHIVVDACSTDGTVDILREYPHLKWTSEPDKGQSDGLNKGFKRATGDLIIWLNSDDALCSGALDVLNKFFSENPDKSVVTGNQILIDAEGRFVRRIHAETYSYDRLLNTRYCSVIQNSTVFRRSVLDKVGLLDVNLHYTMDLDLFIRIARVYDWYKVDEDISKFRVWENSKTSSSQIRFYQNMLVIKKKYRAKLFSCGNFWLLFQFMKYPVKLLFKK